MPQNFIVTLPEKFNDQFGWPTDLGHCPPTQKVELKIGSQTEDIFPYTLLKERLQPSRSLRL